MEVEGFDEEELCPICFTSGLSAEPCVTLACGHTYHLNCVRQLLDHRWNTLRISFAFMQCPSCKQDIEAEELRTQLDQLRGFKTSVEEMALRVARN